MAAVFSRLSGSLHHTGSRPKTWMWYKRALKAEYKHIAGHSSVENMTMSSDSQRFFSMDVFQETFGPCRSLRLRPEQFTSYLTHSVGFSSHTPVQVHSTQPQRGAQDLWLVHSSFHFIFMMFVMLLVCSRVISADDPNWFSCVINLQDVLLLLKEAGSP